MKTTALFIFCLFAQLCYAQQTSADDGFFDPMRDPVAFMSDGRLRLVVSEEVLVRSVVSKFARVGAIERVDRKQFDDKWYLVLESRHALDMEQSVFVAVRLKPNELGEYYADSYWTACTGEGCSSCGYGGRMTGCFCLLDKPGEPGTPGACYQTTSNEPLLCKVPLKKPQK